jgi:mono/diheme cytochrome c family protein
MHIGLRYLGILILCIPVFFCIAWAADRMIPESSPVARGAAYAQTRGCLECHGDPEGLLVDVNGERECSRAVSHPVFDAECVDVLAYFETVRLRRTFYDRVKTGNVNLLIAGEKLVREYHCFQCHGHLGQGGFKNPGSLKGYVPGYFGADFRALTRDADPESVREWIVHGIDSKIVEKPLTGRIAAFFFARQAVSMPSYQSLDPAEIEILVNYVIAINQLGPMTAEIVRSYGDRSQATNSLVRGPPPGAGGPVY